MAAKTERVEARLQPEQRALLEDAAALRGQSLSGFMIGAALAEANSLLEETRVTVIPREFEANFIKLLDAPPGALAASHKRLAEYEPLDEASAAEPTER